MEHNEPVCIASSVEERFLDTYFTHGKNNESQNLEEQCWDAGEPTVQNIKGRLRSLSSNLEKHFSFDNCRIGTPRKTSWTETLGAKTELKTVHGKNTNDIPTNYIITDFKPNELIVIGTYVDKNILPGFQYRVRRNLTDDYLFDGQALVLENVGLGYGKRLTFQGRALNGNRNYFWSDSHDYGFAFSFQALSPDIVFKIIDTKINREIGTVVVNNPARSMDNEISTESPKNGEIQKTVKVHFSGDVTLHNSCLKQKIFYEDMEIHGTAVIHRPDFYSKAKITKINLQNFVAEDCILMLEE